jgi:hypothetical protein
MCILKKSILFQLLKMLMYSFSFVATDSVLLQQIAFLVYEHRWKTKANQNGM